MGRKHLTIYHLLHSMQSSIALIMEFSPTMHEEMRYVCPGVVDLLHHIAVHQQSYKDCYACCMIISIAAVIQWIMSLLHAITLMPCGHLYNGMQWTSDAPQYPLNYYLATNLQMRVLIGSHENSSRQLQSCLQYAAQKPLFQFFQIFYYGNSPYFSSKTNYMTICCVTSSMNMNLSTIIIYNRLCKRASLCEYYFR